MTIREYVSLEILACLIAAEVARGKCSLKWCVKHADEAADLWLAAREEKRATT